MSHSEDEYEIVAACDTGIFKKRILSLLDSGYILYGDVVMAVDGDGRRHFAQVLIKSDKDNNQKSLSKS